MSREIKFRAWKKENSPEMIHIVSSIDWANKEISFRYRLSSWIFRDDKESLDNIILMQYTGLKDKNGVEIYEGDIIRDVDNRTHTVIYERGMFGCYKTWLVSYETGERRKSIESLNNFLVDEAIVIGNIYENPELLEASK